MSETLATGQEAARADRDVHDLHRRVQWFIEKWTKHFDLNKRESAEFSADFTLVVQAVHRDASRTTHELLTRSLSAMPPATFVVGKPD